jgi:hypothetical protein
LSPDAPARRRRRLVRLGRPAAGLAAAAALALVLAQHTAGAVFTTRTANGADRVSAAASFCPGSGSVTLNPDADTTGYQSTPTTLYGSDLRLGALSGISANGRALLHFDLTGAVPAFCSLTGASLQLYVNFPAAGRTIDVYLVTVGSPWSEASTTWNNLPGYGGSAVSSASRSTVGWQSWTVTGLVRILVSGTNNGFLVRDSAEGSATTANNIYDSRGAANKPKLVLTWG